MRRARAGLHRGRGRDGDARRRGRVRRRHASREHASPRSDPMVHQHAGQAKQPLDRRGPAQAGGRAELGRHGIRARIQDEKMGCGVVLEGSEALQGWFFLLGGASFPPTSHRPPNEGVFDVWMYTYFHSSYPQT